jgi:hypothetical protein
VKHLATTPHEDNPQEASRNLFELTEGDEQFGPVGACFDNLSEEVLSRDAVEKTVKLLQKTLETLKDYLVRTCGAHPVLVQLKQSGFPLPECGGGYDFCEEPTFKLSQNYENEWVLNVTARYEHHDDRGGQFEKSESYTVKDGQFCDWCGTALANADDWEAVEKHLENEFYTDGG